MVISKILAGSPKKFIRESSNEIRSFVELIEKQNS
jgi:hypothetical protein